LRHAIIVSVVRRPPTGEPVETAIVTRELTKHYGPVVGIDDVDLEVRAGEVFGFLGPNGAGKTTTMRLLMGLLFPTRGGASILGLDCWKDSVAVKRKVGYLPGEVALYSKLTGSELIAFVAGFDSGDESTGLELAERLGFDLSRRVREASRGMKQKLALTLALMKKPPVLIMDEPTSGLDPLTQRAIYDILSEYRESGTTILFSSHNLFEVERICDRVGIIREGRLVATESIEELRTKRLRHIEVAFADGIPAGLAAVPGVTDIQETGKRVRFKYRGDIDRLIKAIAAYEVSDLSIAHATLEDVFLEFYGTETGGEAR
jgi:ABC-2 type transport system ATP-binding protein